MMTKEEKLHGNKIIGEFVGKSFSMSHITDYKGASDDALPSMKYHSNWHWLIPAWYRFVDLRFPEPMHQFKHSELKTTIGHAVLYGGIALAFSNIVQGIQWYNSLPLKNNPFHCKVCGDIVPLDSEYCGGDKCKTIK